MLLKNGVSASRVVSPKKGGFVGASWFDFLCHAFPYVAAEQWHNRFRDQLVFDESGNPLPLNAPYRSEAAVYYYRHVQQEASLPYLETIVFQDDRLIVVDKPHFLPVIPSGPYVQETVLVRLKNKLGLPDLSPLHRIDRDTAGLVMFSVQASQRGAYQALFRDRLISKQYQALAPFCANLAEQQCPIRVANRLVRADNFMQMHAVAGSVNAITDIVNMQAIAGQPELARYTLSPITGKRHQLRVHMADLGVPILGDEIYPKLMPERDISRQTHAPLQLLAQQLSFIDPFTGQDRLFESRIHLQVPCQ